jgi:hypothetical protein
MGKSHKLFYKIDFCGFSCLADKEGEKNPEIDSFMNNFRELQAIMLIENCVINQ